MRKGLRIRQVAVRHGDPMGRVIGWIQERGGKYIFSYDPYWVHSDCPMPLDLVELPIGEGIWSTERLEFSGPLSLFGRLQPGAFAEETCFQWVSTEAKKKGVLLLEDMPSTPLARLVWMSLLMTDVNYWGLYFDPGAAYPEGGMKMWLPDCIPGQDGSAGWAEVRAKIRIPGPAPALTDQHIRVQGDGRVNIDGAIFPYVVPLPGRAIRSRFVPVKRGPSLYPALYRTEPSGREPRPLRIKRLYMRIAQACGIRVVKYDWTPVPKSAQEVFYWAPIEGRVISHQRSANGLIKWNRKRIEMSALPYAPADFDADLVEPKVEGGDLWIRDSVDVNVFRSGPPFRQVIRLYRAAKEHGHIFDTEEALRRLIFFAYCGTFLADDSSIMLVAERVQDRTGRDQISWRFAPLAGLTPMLMPVRSKQAAVTEVEEMVRAYGAILDIPPESEQFQRIHDKVLAGLQTWDAVLAEMNGDCAQLARMMPGYDREFISGYEEGGMKPMICEAPKNSKKRGRKPAVSGVPTPDYSLEMERLASN